MSFDLNDEMDRHECLRLLNFSKKQVRCPKTQAVRMLVKASPSISFSFDEYPGVVVVPVILTRESTAKEGYIGLLEYQVSDGVTEDRSMSYDVYTWADMLKCVKQLYGEMWKK